MRRFLLSLTALAALVVLVDRAGGALLQRLFDGMENADFDDLRQGARRHPQIAISGSSRARNHYVADSMEQYLGRRVHNFGHGGQFSSIYQYVVTQLVLEEATPEVWVIEADARLYRGNDGRVAELLPYTAENAAIRNAVHGSAPLARLKGWSRLYPYNSLAMSIARARLSSPKRVKHGGFRPLRESLADRKRAIDPLTERAMFPPVDREKLEYLARMVNELRGRGVRLIAVRSPFFSNDSLSSALLAREGAELAEVFASLGVQFIDVTPERFPEFAGIAPFADRRHLEETSAIRFSRIIADSVRAIESRTLPSLPGDVGGNPPRDPVRLAQRLDAALASRAGTQ